MEHSLWISTALMLSIVACVMAIVSILRSPSLLSLERRLVQERDHLRMDNVEAQIRLFSRLIEQSLSVRLHAPTHHHMDALLKRLSDNIITAAEARTLHRLILERGAELEVQGVNASELEFPRILTLWTLEVRLALEGQAIESPVPGSHDL
jgi:hypothetical protein